jgi:tetratricopeptide (TPR) repeat protein
VLRFVYICIDLFKFLGAVQPNIDQALRDLNRAIELNPNEDLAWALRGKVYRLQGDQRLALQDSENAIRLNPQNRLALAEKKDILKSIRNTEKAKIEKEEVESESESEEKIEQEEGVESGSESDEEIEQEEVESGSESESEEESTLLSHIRVVRLNLSKGAEEDFVWKIDRSLAEKLLLEKTDGTFLIRKSLQYPDCIVVSQKVTDETGKGAVVHSIFRKNTNNTYKAVLTNVKITEENKEEVKAFEANSFSLAQLKEFYELGGRTYNRATFLEPEKPPEKPLLSHIMAARLTSDEAVEKDIISEIDSSLAQKLLLEQKDETFLIRKSRQYKECIVVSQKTTDGTGKGVVLHHIFKKDMNNTYKADFTNLEITEENKEEVNALKANSFSLAQLRKLYELGARTNKRGTFLGPEDVKKAL